MRLSGRKWVSRLRKAGKSYRPADIIRLSRNDESWKRHVCNRESTEPGIGRRVEAFLGRVFRQTSVASSGGSLNPFESKLDDIQRVRWHVAARTFGNAHSTLVGLLVDWWISLSPEHHTAIESGPTNGYAELGKRGQCDALFCSDGDPLGLLEVEGIRLIETANKIGYFFDAKRPHLEALEFAVFLIYSYNPTGIGSQRLFAPAITDEVMATIREVTRTHPGKSVAVIGLDKAFDRHRTGVRALNEWYMGSPSRIHGSLLRDGEQIDQATFVESIRQ